MFQGAVLLAFMRDGVNFSTLRVVGSQERDLQARCCRIAALQSRESTANSVCCSASAPIVISLLPRCAPPARFWPFVKVSGEPRIQLLGTGHPCRASHSTALSCKIKLSEATRRRTTSWLDAHR